MRATLRVGDVLEVATARFGHGAEQPLVEVLAHADGGRGDAAPPQLTRMPRQHPRIENADVCQPIGEQDDAPDTRRRSIRIADGLRLGELMAAGDPPRRRGTSIPGIHAVQRQPQTRLEPGVAASGCTVSTSSS